MAKSTTHPKLVKAQMLAQSGKYNEALVLLDKVCKKDKRNADAWFMQGTILGNTGRPDNAIHCLQMAIKLRPNHALSYFNLGNALSSQGKFAEAAVMFSKALSLGMKNPEILRALARAEVNSGRPKQAIPVYREYLQFEPGNPDVLGNLAACHFHIGELDDAVKIYKLALDVRRDVRYLNGLGASLCQQGLFEEAVDVQREAIQLQPDNMIAHSNLLLSLNYLPNLSAQARFDEHRAWSKNRHVNNREIEIEACEVEPERKLRVGYVSPDFRTHSVAYFFAPLLQHLNAEHVDTWCYATSPRTDETTRRLQGMAGHWRDISGLDDAKAIDQIRSDKIDILVDLAGHTAGNRLTIFTAKPAPVQLTWLGYPTTTGLSEIDYRLTDAVADPSGQEKYYTEKLNRLSGCFLCYEPFSGSPDVAPPPMLENGFATFGSFNNLAKINEDVISTWSSLLQSVPNSRLLIKNPSLTDPATAQRYLSRFEQYGVSKDRIELLGLAPTTEDHLNTYKRIDVALDTFPYNGTTTTCEALHMGVPVVALAGESHAGRVSASLLSTLGLEELIASTLEDYINIAGKMVGNQKHLSELRETLRTRMANSPLSDGKAFAKKMEQTYRAIWQEYCSSRA
ncbi:MAG: tetratricopeptide repeat protein [Gammaproteobacteria bacterium]|nr:tetratricopeptide repeat protein [Gammaproteobacteria bacterium]